MLGRTEWLLKWMVDDNSPAEKNFLICSFGIKHFYLPKHYKHKRL